MSLQQLVTPLPSLIGRLARPSSIFEPRPEFLDLLPLAIFACSADGQILWFNNRAVQIWGREPQLGGDGERFSGAHRLYFDGKLTPADQCPMAVALRTGNPVRELEGRIERPDGSTVWATVHIEPVKDEDGQVIGAINCFHETTALHHQADELDDFFENSPVAMHLVSRTGTILRANKAELRMLGYSADEYVGKNIADFHVDAPVIEDILTRLLRLQQIERFPARLRCKDGATKDVMITSNARVRNGEFVNTRCLTLDISDQARAQTALTGRMEEQAALYQFTDRLQRAADPKEIYDAALDAIMRALRCQRSSILLFDDKKIMRFVAWRWLSPEYRRAVEGHSPWSPDAISPQPISIDNVKDALLPDDLKRTVLSEGIQALAFIPLLDGARLLGKFMVYYDQPHVFSPAEAEISLTIARQLAFSIDRRQATQKAQHLVAIVESSQDAIIGKNLDGIIESWNPGAESILGYNADEAIGKPVTMLIPPERLAEEPQILSRIRRGERVGHFETKRRRKDGRLIDVSLSVSPVRDASGRIVGASKILRDITARAEAEAKLRASEKHLQDLLAAIPAAVYTTDAQGKITYFNEAAVELAGRTPVIGSDEWCVTWKLYWPDGRPLPHDECPMAIALKEGRPVRGAEAVLERPDGTRAPFIPYPTPLYDGDGKLVGAINMLVDISERKQAESNQRILLNELNHRVKNNMQMMQSLLDGAARKIQSPDTRRVLDEASRRIAAMAAAQRVLYGTTDATRFKCDEFLAVVCAAAQEMLSPDVKVVWDPPTGDLPNDTAMPLALILNELITNAAKHGANGAIPAIIRVGLTKAADGFVLFVEDEGPGFDLEAVRTQSSGLRLVQGLARQLRGRFAVTINPSRCEMHFA
jgi:PAS domain S-box-containing protein